MVVGRVSPLLPTVWCDLVLCGRIHSGVAECFDIQIFWVRVQRHYFPVDGVEDELIEKRVIGLHEAVDVLVRYSDVHLQVLTDLPDHLDNTTQVCKTDSTQLLYRYIAIS